MTPTIEEQLERNEREWTEANDKINDLYWLFTRSARGKPPVVIAPELYARRAELERERRALKRLLREREYTMLCPECGGLPVDCRVDCPTCGQRKPPTLTARWWMHPEDRHVSRFDRRRFNLSEVPRGDDPELDAMVADWRDRGMLCRLDLIVPMEFEQLEPMDPEFRMRFDHPMPEIKPVFFICMRDEDI